MAAITWRDVAAPNFGGVTQAYQGAGQSLQNAFSGLSEGLKQFATERQAGVDNSILARSLQIQDPTKMRQALVDGTLLQGADLSKVNPKVLSQLDARMGNLLSQASTEQGIASSKTSQQATQQNIDFGAQDQTRKVGQQGIEDAARPQIAQQLGITGPAANMSTDALQKLAGTRSSLASAELSRAGQRISNATGSFNLGKNQRDDAAGQAAMASTANALENNATNDDLRANVLQIQNPQERLLATKAIEAQTGVRLFGTEDAPVSAGVDGAGKPKALKTPKKDANGKSTAPTVGDTSGIMDPDARTAVSEIGRRVAQNNSAGVIADIQKNETDTRDALTVAGDLAKKIPNAKQGKIHEIIAEAMSTYPGLSAADVESAMARSPASGWNRSTNIGSGDGWFGKGIGVDDDAFKANLKSMVNGKAALASSGNQEAMAVDKAIRKADKDAADAKGELIRLQGRKEARPSVDTSKAQKKADQAEFALKQLIRNQQSIQDLQPRYTKDKDKK